MAMFEDFRISLPRRCAIMLPILATRPTPPETHAS
jgi:hypothetical protein